MDGRITLYLERAENELDLASVIFTITSDERLQREVFHLQKTQTFYSAVIAHAYYCMFYSAKAYLHTQNVTTSAPLEHRQVFDAFKTFVDNGTIDAALLRSYETVLLQAQELLGIFADERRKRGIATYQKIAQENREPARESIRHARTFFAHLNQLCGR